MKKPVKQVLFPFLMLLLALIPLLLFQYYLAGQIFQELTLPESAASFQYMYFSRQALVLSFLVVIVPLLGFLLFRSFGYSGSFDLSEKISGQVSDLQSQSADIDTYNRVIELFRSVVIDKETGAVVYKHFLSIMEQEMNRAVRYRIPFSVLRISLENQQNFDVMLKKVSHNIITTLRNVDFVSLDKEKIFTCLLPNTKKADAERACERIFQRMVHVNETMSEKIELVIGVSSFEDDGRDQAKLIDQAETKRKQAKILGPNKVVF